ncbi:MAG TPA: alkaline phosphatase family protein [Candidatus Acidoferrales bacterium]|nr:alkaline phosphatase family protein [Candidatus Acidoferrales bacterium]
MPCSGLFRTIGVSAALIAAGAASAAAQQVKTVFVIALENHNWTQPGNGPSARLQQIYKDPDAPFLNSLVDGTASATVDGKEVNISQQVAYAAAYHNALATESGDNTHVHPSEPNYIWAEAGSNFGVFNDNDPYSPEGLTVQDTNQHLCALLMKAGKTWKSYQEDIDLAQDADGQLTNVPLPKERWTVPLASFVGVFAPGSTNTYNGSDRYAYAAKHNPMAFFVDTNGDAITTVTNPLVSHYAPLQQLFVDLKNDDVADYNWITPDLYNDMHTELPGGYKGLMGDAARIKQGDDFVRAIVPMIMASKAYRDGGAIVIWCDETEPDHFGDNADNFAHTIPEIIISPLAHPNVNGRPYASQLNLSHSSDLRTWQEIFHVGPYLLDAANVQDLSDLFAPDAIPAKP